MARKKFMKQKELERAIKLTFDSLWSHIDGTYLKTKEGRKWHKKCCKEYVEILKVLIDKL